jgi:hypothetical protein
VVRAAATLAGKTTRSLSARAGIACIMQIT